MSYWFLPFQTGTLSDATTVFNRLREWRRTKIGIENGQERDLADSRERSERERELRTLAKHIS